MKQQRMRGAKTRPVLLDLFCGAGGAAMGYARAGFQVIGVDINPQKNYPFEFVQADAMTFALEGFSAIHASPPCQRYSQATPWARKKHHPDLLPPTRKRLEASGALYVIENVPGAPLRADFELCGCNFGLELCRKRLFETNWSGSVDRIPHEHNGPVVSVVGHGTPTWVREKLGYNPTIHDDRAAMGITWMNRNELSEAIPPAYTQYIGEKFIAALEAVAA